MLDFTELNYIAIVLAWIVTVAMGAFWYSPAGFGKTWSKLSGVDLMKSPKSETNRAIMFVAASSALQAFALGVILHTLAPASILESLLATLFIWFGFTAITTIGNTLYQRQSWKFWWINAGFFLVVMAINSIILFVLR